MNNPIACQKWLQWNKQLMHMIYTNLLCEPQSEGRAALVIHVHRSGAIKLQELESNTEVFNNKVTHAVMRLVGHPALVFPAESAMDSVGVFVNVL